MRSEIPTVRYFWYFSVSIFRYCNMDVDMGKCCDIGSVGPYQYYQPTPNSSSEDQEIP